MVMEIMNDVNLNWDLLTMDQKVMYVFTSIGIISESFGGAILNCMGAENTLA